MKEPTWGDTIRLRSDAPYPGRAGTLAAVVAITDIESEAQAEKYGAPRGTKMYLIEFGDGSSIEVAARWIEEV